MIRIAIAEDHNALIDGIKVYVEYMDDILMVGHANNGRELVDLVNRRRPDVVITDIRMPIMDGIEATRRIRSRKESYKDIPVIGLTASVMSDEKAYYLSKGMNSVAEKPINIDKLLEVFYQQLKH